MKPTFVESLESISNRWNGDAGLLEHVLLGLRERDVSSLGWVRFHGGQVHADSTVQRVQKILDSLQPAVAGVRISVAVLPFVSPDATDAAILTAVLQEARAARKKPPLSYPVEDSQFQILASWLGAIRAGRGERRIGGPFSLSEDQLQKLEIENLTLAPFFAHEESEILRRERGDPPWILASVFWR